MCNGNGSYRSETQNPAVTCAVRSHYQQVNVSKLNIIKPLQNTQSIRVQCQGLSRDRPAVAAPVSHSCCRAAWARSTNMGKIVRKIISTPDAPKPGAPYSQAVQVNETLYISGSLGMDLSGQLVPGGIKEQCRQALTNIGAILKAAGIDFKHVVKVTVLLANITDFVSMNEVYKEFFKDHFPARAAYQVGALPKGGLVEIEAVAVVGEIAESD